MIDKIWKMKHHGEKQKSSAVGNKNIKNSKGASRYEYKINQMPNQHFMENNTKTMHLLS